MTPTFTVDNAANLLLEYSVLLGKLRLVILTSLVLFEYLSYLHLRQLMQAMPFAYIHGVSTLSAFHSHVCHVGLRSALKPMSVVVAPWMITGMTDEFSIYDGTDVAIRQRSNAETIPKSCRSDVMRMVSDVRSIPEKTIWATLQTAGPRPAFVGASNVNFRPVAFFKGLTSTHCSMLPLEDALSAANLNDDDILIL